jgi:hypothetical protein
LSFEDWLYRQASETAHNEIIAFLVAILGVNLLVGGLLVTILSNGELVLFPFELQKPLNLTVVLGLILTSVGFIILSAGFILVVHYNRKRSWYVGEIEKSTTFGKKKSSFKTTSEIFEEYTGKRKED